MQTYTFLKMWPFSGVGGYWPMSQKSVERQRENLIEMSKINAKWAKKQNWCAESKYWPVSGGGVFKNPVQRGGGGVKVWFSDR
jgi:hypothetical protein